MVLLDQIRATSDLDAAIALIIEYFHADSGTIHSLGEDGMLHLRAAEGIPDSVREMISVIPVGKGMAGLAAERNEPVTACNIQTDTSGDVRPGAKQTGLEGAIVVPIRDGETPIGALGIANHAERTFTDDEQALLMKAGRVLVERM